VKRATGPQPIGDVLSGVLEQAGVLRQFERLGVLEAWPDIVGEHLAGVTRARGVEDTTLVVEVRSSAWLTELDMMKSDFLRRVNEHVPETPMDRIVFVLAETE
jgi:predicted nucleic acid-binding Zn ribbon protein